VNLEILDLAEADLLNGFAFYERQTAGVGSYFLDSLYSDIESLHLYRGIHRVVLGYHKLLSKRLPFAIYYKIDGEEISVWRILDCRQDPRWIRAQLNKSRTKR